MSDRPILREIPCHHCHGTGKVWRLDGETLRAIRETSKLTQREMARRLKLSAAYINDVENNRRAGNDKIKSTYLALAQPKEQP